jgi:phytoene/squalene synthetase
MANQDILRSSDTELGTFAAAEQICRIKYPLYYATSFILPQNNRRRLMTVIAFLDMAQQAIGPQLNPNAQECCSTSEGNSPTSLIKSRIDSIYSGLLPAKETLNDPQMAILYAFGLTVQEVQIPKDYFQSLVDALNSQREIRRYATRQSLLKHCRETAGLASLILATTLGITHSGISDQAIQIGVAMRHAVDRYSAGYQTRL